MKTKRIVSFILLFLMIVLSAPTVLAEGLVKSGTEKAMLGRLERVWLELDEAESAIISTGAEKDEVAAGVHAAVLSNKLVDEGSVSAVRNGGFTFRVSGMLCNYNYTSRNAAFEPAMDSDILSTISEAVGERNGAANMNVLLVGPFYGQDANFTNQYPNEAASIAEATDGNVTVLSAANATGPAIAAAFPDAGVIIFDSHGADGYLALTTNAGITSEDYQNGWASSSGTNSAYIDGRYIEHHVTRELPNSIVWMAMCEGMIKSNHGETGAALLRAGAGCVYGYSQTVTFGGEYRYETHFWNNMKYNGTTVAEAFNAMTAELGNWDPLMDSSSGAAYPVIMSPVDPYPSNPDAHQTVHSDWKLFGAEVDPVALTSYSLSLSEVDVYIGTSSAVRFIRVPDNANNYELVWHSENETVATVIGNHNVVRVTGAALGTTSIYCDVYANGTSMGRAYCTVNVIPLPPISEVLNVEGGSLEFTSTQYPWQSVLIDGRLAACSGNKGVNNTTSILRLVLDMEAGETLTFDWKVSSENYDKLGFYVNSQLQGSQIAGAPDWETVVYTAQSSGTYTFEWRFKKDGSVHALDDCGYVDNVIYSGASAVTPGDVNADGMVDSSDALIILRSAMGLTQLNAQQAASADVNGDGSVDSADALMILRSSMGL
jgi:hypothetical protein